MVQDDSPLVLKFGGTSVGSPARIQNVARIIKRHRESFKNLVVVVSAMGDTTDDLINLATEVSPRAASPFHKREMDMLLTAGERISMSLLSMALGDLGVPAISLTGSQTGIMTDTLHGEAKIHSIKPVRLPEIFAAGKVAIVAGFQGISQQKEVTTLGRGGSDTSAVALACVLAASEARIFTDVDGVFSADPRRVPTAKLWPSLHWETVIDAAYSGAQVLHPRCVELARQHGMSVRVLSSFQDSDSLDCKNPGGTLVFGELNHFEKGECVPNQNLEGPQIKIISQRGPLARLNGLFANPEELKNIFDSLRRGGISLADISIAGNKLTAYVRRSELHHFDSAAGVEIDSETWHQVTVLGTGLASAFEIQQQIFMTALALGHPVVDMKCRAQSIDLIFNTTTGVNGLLEKFHEILI